LNARTLAQSLRAASSSQTGCRAWNNNSKPSTKAVMCKSVQSGRMAADWVVNHPNP
jgi:hypothetical protein